MIMHRIKASWFMYKELTLAFSIHILFARFGSATSYLLIGSLVGPIGLQPCLWIGFGLMTLASIACVVMAYVDERGAAISETSPSNISLTVIRDFFKSLDLLFWCYAAMVFVSYGATATFTANGPNFIAVSAIPQLSVEKLRWCTVIGPGDVLIMLQSADHCAPIYQTLGIQSTLFVRQNSVAICDTKFVDKTSDSRVETVCSEHKNSCKLTK